MYIYLYMYYREDQKFRKSDTQEVARKEPPGLAVSCPDVPVLLVL